MASLARNSSCALTHSGFTVHALLALCATTAGAVASSTAPQTIHFKRSRRTNPPLGQDDIDISPERS
jgi:hypothetical protein